MLDCLGLSTPDGTVITSARELEGDDSLKAVSAAAGYMVRARAGKIADGSRMGRPEKAKERELTPKIHCIFPMGKEPSSPGRTSTAR